MTGHHPKSATHPSRRDFLKRATATAGGLALPAIIPGSALGLSGAVAPSNRIVMGCIGVGGQGIGNMHAFMGRDDMQIVAVCDVDEGSAAFEGRDQGLRAAQRRVDTHYAALSPSGTVSPCATYRDFRDLLGRDDIDAVTVCTPDHWHGLIAVAAAKAGKDIYCEKPLTNTIAEGRAVCDAVERYGRVLQTGSHERSRQSVRFACELVRNGRIGKLHTIRVNMPNSDGHHQQVRESLAPEQPTAAPEGLDYDFWLGHTPRTPYTPKHCHFWWRFVLDYGGGEMTDRGAHIIDLGQLANASDDTGPIELRATGKANVSGPFDAFMEYDFECLYANGVRLIGASVDPRGLKFEGDEGWIFIHIHGGRLEAEPDSLLGEVIGPDEVHLGRAPGHHDNFIQAVKHRGVPFASAEVGHRTATICHLLNIAMRTGQPIRWDPVKERVLGNEAANRFLSPPMRAPWHL